eukprot:1158429-Rhodomonas_salina.1
MGAYIRETTTYIVIHSTPYLRLQGTNTRNIRPNIRHEYQDIRHERTQECTKGRRNGTCCFTAPPTAYTHVQPKRPDCQYRTLRSTRVGRYIYQYWTRRSTCPGRYHSSIIGCEPVLDMCSGHAAKSNARQRNLCTISYQERVFWT